MPKVTCHQQTACDCKDEPQDCNCDENNEFGQGSGLCFSLHLGRFSAIAALLKHFTVDRQATYGELTFFGDTRYSACGRALRNVLDRAAERLFRAALKMPVDVYEGPAMNHSYHEMIIGHGGCFSTIVVAESDRQADYHRAQYLATQMALAERGRVVVSITLRDLEDASLRALDEFFRQATTHIRQAK